jgi:hypothetical protein
MRTAILVLTFGLSLPAARGDDGPPRIRFSAPLALIRGTETRVLLRGQGLDRLTEVTAPDQGGVEVRLESKSKSSPPANYDAARGGDSQAEIVVKLPAGFARESLILAAKAGDSPLESASLPILNGAVSLPEQEPNPGFKQFQKVARGQTVIGAIHEPKNVDVFRIEESGPVRVAVIAAGRGSLLDPLLTVYDERGKLLASVDDSHGRDARSDIDLPAGGGFVVIQDAIDNGGPLFPYLLEITADPRP